MRISKEHNLQQSKNIHVGINPDKIVDDFLFWEEFKKRNLGSVFKIK
jgi:hypothetical protein